MCGVREYSNFILIFITKEPAWCPPQWLLPISIPSISVGGFCFSTPAPGFTVCRVSVYGHCDGCEVINLVEVLICISLIFSDVDIFSCDLLKHCELNFLIQIGFLNACPTLNIFLMNSPRTFLEEGVFYF